MGISGLNPKGLLLLLALLSQFADAASAWPIPAQMMVLGLVHVLSCAGVYCGVGVGARTVLRARPALPCTVSRFCGVAMVAIAARSSFTTCTRAPGQT